MYSFIAFFTFEKKRTNLNLEPVFCFMLTKVKKLDKYFYHSIFFKHMCECHFDSKVFQLLSGRGPPPAGKSTPLHKTCVADHDRTKPLKHVSRKWDPVASYRWKTQLSYCHLVDTEIMAAGSRPRRCFAPIPSTL